MPRWAQRYGEVLKPEQEKQYELSGLEGLERDEKTLSKTELGIGRELPRWQTQPINMIEDVMSRWLGPIKDEESYKGVQDRLQVLKIWLPRLKGYILKQAQTAIKLLEERVSEYQKTNLRAYISLIAEFVKQPLAGDAAFNKAQEYHQSLVNMRPHLRGTWAQVLDKYAAWLKERMDEYRGMTPKPVKLESPKPKVQAPKRLSTGKPTTLGQASILSWENVKKVLPWGIAMAGIGVVTYGLARKK